MMRTRLARRLLAAALPCLLLAACTGSRGGDDPPPTPGRSPTEGAGPSLPLQKQPSASDSGAVAVSEVGFTVLDQRESGSAVVVWAATFENTSAADLLAYVDFELRWSNQAGETEVSPWDDSSQQRAYDVLPGRPAVVGGATDVGFVPDALDVSVHADEWYPMADLDAHGLTVGVAVIGYRIQIDTAVRVRAEFTSAYDGRDFPGDDDLRLLVVQRDAAGELLGAVEIAELGIPASGEQHQRGSVPLSRWPDDADPDTSQVEIMRVCCTWVGVT